MKPELVTPVIAPSVPVRFEAHPANERPAVTPAKVLKKARKRERLRFFLAWCAGCRFMSGSF
ncbi:hypothetical protein [Hymenobacter siberiensis]|jgi:hypothetical protein|uniref:hypothetical protein n=1 Tax=Hymenobacter siberiensis TaxID=2848396 RepID=UPI001C1E1043|nr:hypothetical protein [Hymenobacter siberiensis]MBU6121226.1 hypothetical protein [Hymenobacter siberiensis]